MKKILLAAVFFAFALNFSFIAHAQLGVENVPKGWHLKDYKTDGYYGISLKKAYEFVKQKGLKSTSVIVGIIDSGIDTCIMGKPERNSR